MSQAILGLDIGGANLKAALNNGSARSRRFDLWMSHESLAQELLELTSGWRFDRIAVTMTGELCRCFATKREGVRFILDQARVFANGKPVVAWGLDGKFHPIEDHGELNDFAATNWLALANFAGHWVPRGRAVLVDVGSTTTDVIPLHDGRPTPIGRTDAARLQTGELIYTGVRATPICALLGWSVMAETFATTLDAYLTLGHIPTDPEDCDTADYRPATRECAQARLARMLGGDAQTIQTDEIRRLAEETFARQRDRIAESISRHGSDATQIISGAGEFLARAACDECRPIRSIAEELGSDVSRAACAYAVAVLAAEQMVTP